MEDSPKETVIIVHGTWAAAGPGAGRWYQPLDGMTATGGFVAKLDAALEKRGSRARCWAHCAQGNPIFQWSGENSWIARTRAASVLGDYVAKLGKDGWRYHIIAHSHGGNVVIEALPLIMINFSTNVPPGKIVTLGTPFIDTMSPILARAKYLREMLDLISWIVVLMALSVFVFILAAGKIPDFINWPPLFSIAFAVAIFAPALFFLTWREICRIQTESAPLSRTAQTQPLILAIGSPKDEAWQVLHHMRNIDNPLAVRSNLFSYLFSSLRFNISRSAQVAHIHGAKSYRDLGTISKCVLFIAHLIFLFIALFACIMTIVILNSPENFNVKFVTGTITVIGSVTAAFVPVFFLARFLGTTFYSAFLSPFRWCTQRAVSLMGVLTEIMTYGVRYWGWSVLQAMAMGLEGYRFKIPPIEQRPSNIPEEVLQYESMPTGAEQRALAMRNAWIGRHFGDVSETFSKIVVTAADISLLLRTVEADQSLVHAAYYTDDECIRRIADWIAGRK